MLEPVSEQVRECHERAAEAKGKAEATADPALKAEFLDIERRWLALARSHTGTESLEDFRAAIRTGGGSLTNADKVTQDRTPHCDCNKSVPCSFRGATSTRYMTASSTRPLPQFPRTWQACR